MEKNQLKAERVRNPSWFWSYGLAHFGKSLFWSASELLFAFFLTEVAHIPPRQMGLVLAAGLFCGAVADLGVGRAIQARLSHAGGAARIQLLGAYLNGIALFLMLLGPFLPQAHRFVYLMTTGLLFRIAFSVYDIPQNAVMSLATSSSEARTRLASTRMFFSGVSSLLIASALFPVLMSAERETKAFYFLALGGVMSIVAILTAFGLRRQLGDKDYTTSLVPSDLKAMSLPRSVWLFILFMSAVTGLASVFGKVEPYYATYVIKSAIWGSAIASSLYVGLTLSQPVWNWMASRTSRKHVLALCAIVMLAMAGLYLALGRLPYVAFGVAFGFGIANGGIAGMMWAIFADKAANAAHGREGMAYSMLAAGMKTGIGTAVLVIGELLTTWDYRVSETTVVIEIACAAMFSIGCAVLAFTRRSAV